MRANTTTATPLNGGGPGAEYELTGHKWFFSAPMCDAFLVLAQAEGGISCFLMPRFTPDGERNRIQHPAAQGQARQPLERLERGRVPRRLGAARRRGGSRRADDHRDGQPHAPRLRARRRGRDAVPAPRWRSTTPRTASAFGKLLAEQPLMQNVLADLAVESEAAHDLGAAAGARLRRGRAPGDRSRRPAVQADRQRGAQVLDLQAGADARGRGARVLRRQRLRRGVGDAAALPRGAAELDLGGLGQRPVPRRPAGDGPQPRAAGGVLRRGRRGRRRRRRGSTLRPPSSRDELGDLESDRVARPPRGRADGAGRSRARCWSASATRRSPTRSAPRGSPATGARRSAPCRPASTTSASSTATRSRPAPHPRLSGTLPA